MQNADLNPAGLSMIYYDLTVSVLHLDGAQAKALVCVNSLEPR